MIERAKQLLIDNPNLTYKKFKDLTGLKRWVFDKLKDEIHFFEEVDKFALRVELKRKMEVELMRTLRKNGFLNARGTFLERM
jgi:hypothetical protein